MDSAATAPGSAARFTVTGAADRHGPGIDAMTSTTVQDKPGQDEVERSRTAPGKMASMG